MLRRFRFNKNVIKERIMPHCRATIRNIDGGFKLETGVRHPEKACYESFASVYKDACEYLCWNMEYLTLDILPPDIRKTINDIQEEHRKKSLEDKVSVTYSAYLKAKKELEVNNDEIL